MDEHVEHEDNFDSFDNYDDDDQVEQARRLYGDDYETDDDYFARDDI